VRVKDIKVGGTYVVHLDERTAGVYKGTNVEARVIRAGFHYEVETVTGTMVRGAPMHRYHESEHPVGVEIEWDEQEVETGHRHRSLRNQRIRPGRATVNARQVKYEKIDL
jgi:hypothetical protein